MSHSLGHMVLCYMYVICFLYIAEHSTLFIVLLKHSIHFFKGVLMVRLVTTVHDPVNIVLRKNSAVTQTGYV